MKIKLLNKTIDLKPLFKQSDRNYTQYVYKVGLYNIEIDKYKSNKDTYARITANFKIVKYMLIPKDKTTKLSEILQECADAITNDIYEKENKLTECQAVLDSVKCYK